MSYFVDFLSKNVNKKVWFRFKESGELKTSFKLYIIKQVEDDCVFLQDEHDPYTILIPIDNISYIKMNYEY